MPDDPQTGDPSGDDDGDESDPFRSLGLPGDPFGEGGPFGPGGPFGAGGMDLAQVMRMLQSGGSGPLNWDLARQVATWGALQGGEEPVVSSADHDQFEELALAAQTHVVAETELAATFRAPVRTLGPKAWAELHLDALKPVLEALAGSLGQAMQQVDTDDLPEDAEAEALDALPPEFRALGLGNLAAVMKLVAPLFLGFQAGSMVGQLAQHALGRYDLALPASDSPSLCFVVKNVDEFEAAWSLPRADLRFYVAIHEVVHAAQRSVPWVQERLVALAVEYASGYALDPDAIERALGDLDPNDPETLKKLASDPRDLLGAMQTPAQRAVLPRLQNLVAVLEGYADTILERVGEPLLPSFGQIHEAMQRHRLERGAAERTVELMLGLEIGREHYEQGKAFAAGVVERAGIEGLNRLFVSDTHIPTPAEIEAPGLWLARIDLPG